MNDLVSIILPVYNSEKHIRKCLESLCNQKYNSIEIIVVDDGSTDKSAKIVKEMRNDDKRIRYFYKENSGVSNARNFGIEKSFGEYVTFVDSDDWVSTNFIEEAMQCIHDNDLDIVSGGTERMFVNFSKKFIINSKIIKVYTFDQIKNLEKKVIGYNSEELPEINGCFMSGSVCKIFKKDIVENIKFKEELKIGEDTIYNIEALRNASRVGIVPNIWYYYRMNDESATRKINEKIAEEMKNTLIQLKKMKIDEISYKRRVVSSIYGIFDLYPFHALSRMNIKSKKKYLKNFMDDEFWKENLTNINLKDIEDKKNQFLLFLCKKKLYNIIIILYELKKDIKEKTGRAQYEK